MAAEAGFYDQELTYQGFNQDHFEGQSTKRKKLDDGSALPITSPENPHYAPPSKVVHVRSVSEAAREQDIVRAIGEFGRISCITTMPRLKQALVEFEDVECAQALVSAAQDKRITICGKTAFFNFSKSQSITRFRHVEDASAPANNILLLTILNPQYEVTTAVDDNPSLFRTNQTWFDISGGTISKSEFNENNLHEVFQGYGYIQRIVIFRKNGLQAMVEFETETSAQQAKDALNGWDLYEGYNTLKIEFAKAKKLNVYKNDHESWDYTRPAPDQFRLPPGGRGRGLLNRPPFQQRAPNPGFGRQDFAMHPPRGPPGAGGCVLMAYGFDPDKLSCEAIFNLLCPFGNVLKVKLMSSKPGCAMVEMSDHVSCNTIIQNLSGFKIMDSELKFSFSKQNTLTCPPNYNPAVEHSFKDFFDSKLHRFTTAEACSKNRVFSPTKILHFYNAPPNSTEDSIRQLFMEKEVTPPTVIKVFPDARKSATGLMEWSDVSCALEALMLMNHVVIRNADAHTIFTIKLAFSSAGSASS